MKLELTDAKIQRMAQAINVLQSLEGMRGADYEDIPIRYNTGSSLSVGHRAHPNTWPTLKPIFDAFRIDANALCCKALADARTELRRIADGGEEQ